MPSGTTLDTTYAVADGSVTLTVDIGEGQLGDSSIHLEDTDITPNDTAHIRDLPSVARRSPIPLSSLLKPGSGV